MFGSSNGIGRSWSWVERTIWTAIVGARIIADGEGALVTLDIHAWKTDPSIEVEQRFHVVVIDPAARRRNKLFLFLPGSGGNPGNARLITATAARLGFHAIALRYPLEGKVAEICQDSLDSNCHGRVRQEIIEGADSSEEVAVSRAESLENRLIQLIRYLDEQRPEDRWGQFLGVGPAILWERIQVAGLSQGGSHANWIALKHPVDRCLIMANQDWWRAGRRLSDWQFQESKTPPERYFGFIHRQDVGYRSGQQQQLWETLGMTRFGPPVLVEETGPWYRGSHTLTSELTPQSGADGKPNFHGSVAVDDSTPLTADGEGSLFEPVWRHLMTGPLAIPTLAAAADRANGLIEVSWPTVAGMHYQLQSSADMRLWRTEESALGDGQRRRARLPTGGENRFFRLIGGDPFDFE